MSAKSTSAVPIFYTITLDGSVEADTCIEKSDLQFLCSFKKQNYVFPFMIYAAGQQLISIPLPRCITLRFVGFAHWHIHLNSYDAEHM